MHSLLLFITRLLTRKAGPSVPLLPTSLPQATPLSHVVPCLSGSLGPMPDASRPFLGGCCLQGAVLRDLSGAQPSPLPRPGATVIYLELPGVLSMPGCGAVNDFAKRGPVLSKHSASLWPVFVARPYCRLWLSHRRDRGCRTLWHRNGYPGTIVSRCSLGVRVIVPALCLLVAQASSPAW